MADRSTKQLLASLDRIAALLRSPNVPGQIDHAEAVALSISQGAPSGVVAELALRVVAALGALNRFPDVPAYMVTVNTALRHLRDALRATDEGGVP
ncbi:MAG TPA: hypothetical protein VEU32_06925 [Burkholderiales bacterium]|nr:hypothetical protein [Burkholderiales bacterium]